MIVTLHPADGGPAERISSPGDLRGKLGTLEIEGPPEEHVFARWSLAVGSFVFRGGAVAGPR